MKYGDDYKIVFVILHYENYGDTVECIRSIQKYLNENVNGVIIDNGSVNGKLGDIKKELDDLRYLYFIRSEQNLGFANGNNIGFRFAKNKLKADIILLCNNDLIFEQNEFIHNLSKLYSKVRFDVGGPKIVSLVDNLNQNPDPVQYKSVKDVEHRILKLKILCMLNLLNLDVLGKKIFAHDKIRMDRSTNKNFQLHGSCLIFGSEYIKKYDGLYDGTFMYCEESILKYISLRDGLSMVYADTVEVKHKEGSSTSYVFGRSRKKRQFYYKWNLHSCRLLKALMEKDYVLEEKLKFRGTL